MRRRRFIQTLAAAPATSLIAQQPAPPQSPESDLPKLDFAVPDAAAETVRHFFTTSEFAVLQKLGGILMPATSPSSSAGGPAPSRRARPSFWISFSANRRPIGSCSIEPGSTD
jgi:hypothetical protein